jgi:hypothetical protein
MVRWADANVIRQRKRGHVPANDLFLFDRIQGRMRGQLFRVIGRGLSGEDHLAIKHIHAQLANLSPSAVPDDTFDEFGQF